MVTTRTFIFRVFLFFAPFALEGKELFLLITGCGRSGTTYISKVLKKCGLDVNHERLGRDGIVSWPMGVDAEYPLWGPTTKELTFVHTFHQIRHPLDVISSFYYNKRVPASAPKSWKYIYDNVPQIRPTDPPLAQLAMYWYYWNLAAESKAEWSYRIEEIAEVFLEMGERLGLVFEKSALDGVGSNANRRQHYSKKDRFDWSDIEAVLPEDDYLNLRALAIRYGYVL